MAVETLTEKARRLVNGGNVNIVTRKVKYIHAEVTGDHNEYKVMIWYNDDGKPNKAKCGCAWNVLRREAKHWCSHIRSVLVVLGREEAKEGGKVAARRIKRD